ncbi:PAS domain S-box protein [bacterium]|nr:PAS domain S-box protein [bacterium]
MQKNGGNMNETVKILFVEDVRTDAELIWTEITRSGIAFEKVLVDNEPDYVSAIGNFMPELIISDYSLPQFDGFTALIIKNSLSPGTPFILVTGSVNEETAIEIMKAGADDYVLKDNLSRLGGAIRSAISKKDALRVKEAALDALRESEERFRLAVENSPVPVMIHDEDGKVLMLSKGWTHYSGYTVSDIPTVLDWTRAAYGSEAGAERNLIDQLFSIRETKDNGEWIIRTKTGETRIWEFHATPLGRVSEGKKVLQSLAIDITESRKMQEMLIRERDRAEESDRLKTAFLHNISHELRTPMNAIIGFSALMAEPGQTDEVRKSYSEIIMNSCNQLMDVVSDIIEISNIEAGILKYRKEIFNLKSQLNAIHRQYQVRAAEKNLAFDCIIQIPDEEAFVETNLSKLVTIVTNLLNNAFKFTHEGSVELGCIKEGDFLRFSVSDTGIGIPEDSQGRIFERFYQVEHTTSRSYEGAGLGLSISRAYVEFLGGTIRFTSKPGEGSVFEFTIPCTPATGKDYEPGIRLTGRREAPVFSRTLKIDNEEYVSDRRIVI